jgi:predicted dehydrogenase
VAMEVGAQKCDSALQLSEVDEIDAVIVATPEDQHADVALTALAGGKHVFIEKPLASSVADAEKIVQAAGLAKRIVSVAHVLRHDPAYGYARDAVRLGRVGDLVHLQARRNTSIDDADRLQGRVSVIDYLGIHDIDALQWVSGQRIVSVMAQGTKKRMAKYQVDDAVQALLRFEGDAIGTLECSWLRPRAASGAWGSSMSIWGTEGAVEVTPYVQAVNVAAQDSSNGLNQAYLTESGAHGEITGIYRDELLSFVRCIRGEGSPSCTGEEGLAAVRVTEAIKASLRTGEWVSVES